MTIPDMWKMENINKKFKNLYIYRCNILSLKRLLPKYPQSFLYAGFHEVIQIKKINNIRDLTL